MSFDFNKKFGYVLGLKHVYVVYGKYMGIKEGTAVNFSKKELFRYNIRELLNKYPALVTDLSEAAAVRQEKADEAKRKTVKPEKQQPQVLPVGRSRPIV